MILVSPKNLKKNPELIRRKKQQFKYEGKHEPIEDSEQNFKVNFYFSVQDSHCYRSIWATKPN